MGFSAQYIWLCLAVLVCSVCQHTTARVLMSSGIEDDVADLSIDEILEKASAQSGSNYYYDSVTDEIVTDLDIAVSPFEFLQMSESNFDKRASAIKTHRWTNNRVNYEIAANTFNPTQTKAIKDSMADWAKYTCLTFKESKTAKARIYIRDGSGCHSVIGMRGSKQNIGLGGGCRYKKIILHELAHALGYHHEQTRPDRDEYIRVNFQNIQQGRSPNFSKKMWSQVAKTDVPYDYFSIMHYAQKAFSKNKLTTIDTIDPKYQKIIGNQKTLSFYDVKGMNLIYNCAGADTDKCDLKHSDCPGEGFVGKDCKCWCRGMPITHCQASG